MILGYTEIPVKVSKVYWKFRGYTQISEQSTEISVDDLGVYWFFINVEGYTDYNYKGAAGEKISIFGGILKFFSMRVGGAAGMTCNADFQFPMP